MKTILKITICLLIVSQGFSQTVPTDTSFFNPTFGPSSQTISPSDGTGDDSSLFSNAINAVNAAGGGKVIVNAGTYRILEVDIKSNVHIEVNYGAIFLPFNPSTTANNAMFNLDSNVGINNCSLIGVGGNFTMDLSALATTIRVRAISFKYCSNFKTANFNITDNNTEFSSLAFGSNYTTTGTGANRRINFVRGIPNGGIIDNISVINAHYGYGLVQIQGGKNILFRDLSSVGGATLRLETGFNLLQYTELFDFEDIKLDNLWARNISGAEGQSALQLSPHTLNQGYFNASDIECNSCEATVVWAAGFATNTQETDGLIPGSFESTSKIRNVTATFGQNAQMRSSRLRYIPCELRVERSGGVGVSATLNPDGESYAAPSPGSVIREEDKPGHYALDFPDTEVTANGYNIEAHYLAPSAIFSSSFDDYEICDESVSGVDFFVPLDFRDTPNPRNPLENGGLSNDDFELAEVKIYPNPSSGMLTIKLLEQNEDELMIYDVLGKQVGYFKLQLENRIDVTHLNEGVYFMVFKSGTKQKLVIKQVY